MRSSGSDNTCVVPVAKGRFSSRTTKPSPIDLPVQATDIITAADDSGVGLA
jgi:hypothetical protein